MRIDGNDNGSKAEYGSVVPAEPNNAFLVSIAVYTELVPAFERLLAENGGDLPALYKRVRELAGADKKARALALYASAPSTRDPSQAPRR